MWIEKSGICLALFHVVSTRHLWNHTGRSTRTYPQLLRRERKVWCDVFFSPLIDCRPKIYLCSKTEELLQSAQKALNLLRYIHVKNIFVTSVERLSTVSSLLQSRWLRWLSRQLLCRCPASWRFPGQQRSRGHQTPSCCSPMSTGRSLQYSFHVRVTRR